MIQSFTFLRVGPTTVGWACRACGRMNRKRGHARAACIYCDEPDETAAPVGTPEPPLGHIDPRAFSFDLVGPPMSPEAVRLAELLLLEFDGGTWMSRSEKQLSIHRVPCRGQPSCTCRAGATIEIDAAGRPVGVSFA